MRIKQDLGQYLQNLRKENGYSLKYVAEHVGIDTSMLSKIEHGERQLQGHMLKRLAELFELSYKDLQIQMLNQKIEEEFGEEPFLKEALKKYLQEI